MPDGEMAAGEEEEGNAANDGDQDPRHQLPCQWSKHPPSTDKDGLMMANATLDDDDEIAGLGPDRDQPLLGPLAFSATHDTTATQPSTSLLTETKRDDENDDKNKIEVIASPTTVLATSMTELDAVTLSLSLRSKPRSRAEDKARRRQWERESRQRRQAKTEEMRSKVAALECAVSNILVLQGKNSNVNATTKKAKTKDKAAVARSGSSDWNAQRMQAFLRQSMALNSMRQQLQRENTELQDLLRQHQESTETLTRLMRGLRVDDWTCKAARWSEIAHTFFTPWTREQCVELVEDSLRRIAKFRLTDDLVTHGMQIAGWQDQRRLDPSSNCIEFAFYKNICGGGAKEAAQTYWEQFLDGKSYSQMFLGPNSKIYYEVLQQIAPDLCIVRTSEQYSDSPRVFHQLFLLFRRQSGTKFLVGARSIVDAALETATEGPDAMWARNFHWALFEVVAQDDAGACRAHRSWGCGQLSSQNMTYPRRWLTELTCLMPRAESVVYGHYMLEAESGSNTAC